MSVTWDAETLRFYPLLCLFWATVPSECHMKNSFFLNNYPVKWSTMLGGKRCIGCKHASYCVNSLFVRLSGKFTAYKRDAGFRFFHPTNNTLAMSTGYEFPVLHTTLRNLLWPVDECEESSDSHRRLQMFLPVQTCFFSNTVCTQSI